MSYAKMKGLFLVLLTLSVAACSSDTVGKTVPVKGKVMVDGKALAKGTVAFWPDEDKGNKSTFTPGGTIADDGTYELFTEKKKGAPPGHYKVTIVAQEEADSTSPKKAKLLVPAAVTKKGTTTLLIEVTDDANKAYDLNVK